MAAPAPEPSRDREPRTPGAPSHSRDHVLIGINGELHTVRGADAFSTLSTFLRETLRLVGTKIVCSEGDCGACTVLVGTPDPSGFAYRAIDSCIAFLYQLDRCHVITVEGLANASVAANGSLHPAQIAMAENFGSQCGYCTPGFVVAMASLTEEARAQSRPLDEASVRIGLSGNLCRCTGYVQILESAASIDPTRATALNHLYDPARLLAAFAETEDSVRIEHQGHVLAVPASLDEALEERRREPAGRVVAGATDLGVQHNKGMLEPGGVLHLRHDLDGFSHTRLEGDRMVLGAGARWSDVETLARSAAPQLAEILEIFGAPQIRNAGTVGGNLVNASPIADSLPFFYACEAILHLRSVTGQRSVPVEAFYLGYKQLDLRPDELLVEIEVPLPREESGEQVRLLKVSRRRDLDISTFTAALWIRHDGTTIDTARLAFGGVGPTVIRAREAEQILTDAPFQRDTFRRAGERAASEIAPISDVRGEASYRTLLARNALLRFFHDLHGASP